MEIVNGVAYDYVKEYPNGDKVYGFNGKITNEKQKELNEVLSRMWDALPDEKKRGINKRIKEAIYLNEKSKEEN